jgi:hypothetical protein
MGKSHRDKIHLFQEGLRRGFVTSQEVDAVFFEDQANDAERWLLYYSLQAAEIEIRNQKSTADSSSPTKESEPSETTEESGQSSAPSDEIR